MKSYIDLGKLILLTYIQTTNSWNELARPVMGTIFLVIKNSHVNKAFWKLFQIFAPPSLLVIRVAKFQRENVSYVRIIIGKR